MLSNEDLSKLATSGVSIPGFDWIREMVVELLRFRKDKCKSR